MLPTTTQCCATIDIPDDGSILAYLKLQNSQGSSKLDTVPDSCREAYIPTIIPEEQLKECELHQAFRLAIQAKHVILLNVK